MSVLKSFLYLYPVKKIHPMTLIKDIAKIASGPYLKPNVQGTALYLQVDLFLDS